MISGDRRVDVYGRFGEFLAENGVETPLQACVSLGWGSGGLERDLLARRLIADIDAYDLSADAITEPPRAVGTARAGVDPLPCCRLGWFQPAGGAIRRSLCIQLGASRPCAGNAVRHYSQGPEARRYLSSERVCRTDALSVDRRSVAFDKRVSGHFAGAFAADPGRAESQPWNDRASSKCWPRIRHPPFVRRKSKACSVQYFEIVEERPYGGTLLHIGLFGIAQNFAMDNSEDIQHLKRFFDAEDRAIGDGVIGNDFAVLTAQPVVRGRRAKRGACFTTQLRPSPEFAFPGVDLTISNADNMRQSTDDHYLSVGRSAISAIERSLGGGVPRAILDLSVRLRTGDAFPCVRATTDAAITVSDLDESGVSVFGRAI